MKVQRLLWKYCDCWVLLFSENRLLTVCTIETLSLRFRGDHLLIRNTNIFSLHHWQDFPSRNMATLRNKRKLAAVSRETPEGSRSSRGRNVIDPELTQDYISQVSEEIEGRVTKKLSKEFNETESRILGASSKLDEFLLNPQERTCSVVQGASRNANSENRETHGDRSSNDPYPEGGYFPHHSGQLNSPETETNSHMVTETYPHKYIIPYWVLMFESIDKQFYIVCHFCNFFIVRVRFLRFSYNLFLVDSFIFYRNSNILWFLSLWHLRILIIFHLHASETPLLLSFSPLVFYGFSKVMLGNL